MAMLCSRAFHQICIRTYCSTVGLTLDQLPCPCCKRYQHEFTSPERSAAVPSLPPSWTDVEFSREDAEPIAAADDHGDAFHEADAETVIEASPTAGPEDENAATPIVPAAEAPAPSETSAASSNGEAQTTGQTHPMFPKPSVYCTTCGKEAHVMKCRLVNKTQGLWRCPNCCSKITQLHRSA